MFDKIKKIFLKNKQKQKKIIEQEKVEQTNNTVKGEFYTGEGAPFIYTKSGEKLYVGQIEEPTSVQYKKRR